MKYTSQYQLPPVRPLICDYGSCSEFTARQPRCWCYLGLGYKSTLVFIYDKKYTSKVARSILLCPLLPCRSGLGGSSCDDARGCGRACRPAACPLVDDQGLECDAGEFTTAPQKTGDVSALATITLWSQHQSCGTYVGGSSSVARLDQGDEYRVPGRCPSSRLSLIASPLPLSTGRKMAAVARSMGATTANWTPGAA